MAWVWPGPHTCGWTPIPTSKLGGHQQHSPEAMADWTAPHEAWSDCCGSQTSAPGPGQGSRGSVEWVGCLWRPHLPPQSCIIQMALSHTGPVHPCNLPSSLPDLAFLHTSQDRALPPSLPALLMVISLFLYVICFLPRLCSPAQPQPQGPTLPAASPLPASAGQPTPLADSRGRCGSASAIADWSWP